MDMFEFVIGDGRLLEEEAEEIYFIRKSIMNGRLGHVGTQLLLLANDLVHSLASAGLLAEQVFSLNMPMDLANEIQSAVIGVRSAQQRFRTGDIRARELRAAISDARIHLRGIRKKVAAHR